MISQILGLAALSWPDDDLQVPLRLQEAEHPKLRLQLQQHQTP